MALFLIFVAVPLIEIALFIQVGGAIGLWPTLLVVVLTAAAGTLMVRAQGLATLDRLRSSLERGEEPVSALAHGVLILAAGLLLLTPGFFTDTLGFALLVPRIRALVIARGLAHAMRRAGVSTHGGPPPGADVEEAEVIEEDFPTKDRAGRSGWTRPW